MQSIHNINTCLRRLRNQVQATQGRWGTIIDAEAREAIQENTFGIVDCSEQCVNECIEALENAGFYKRASDRTFSLIRLDGTPTFS